MKRTCAHSGYLSLPMHTIKYFVFLFFCRQTELEALGSALQQYRDGHSALIKWIEETTERQENTQPGQTDSKALSEQLAQQTVS